MIASRLALSFKDGTAAVAIGVPRNTTAKPATEVNSAQVNISQKFALLTILEVGTSSNGTVVFLTFAPVFGTGATKAEQLIADNDSAKFVIKVENNGKTVIEEDNTCDMANIYLDLARKIINE